MTVSLNSKIEYSIYKQTYTTIKYFCITIQSNANINKISIYKQTLQNHKIIFE